MTIEDANKLLVIGFGDSRFHFVSKKGNWFFDGTNAVFPCTTRNGSGKRSKILDIHFDQAVSFAEHRLRVERQKPKSS